MDRGVQGMETTEAMTKVRILDSTCFHLPRPPRFSFAYKIKGWSGCSDTHPETALWR
jgi:hypothetical protein